MQRNRLRTASLFKGLSSTPNVVVKLNTRVSLRDRAGSIRFGHRAISPPGSTMAKPPVEYIPADGFVPT
jgi:hypothetical protein